MRRRASQIATIGLGLALLAWVGWSMVALQRANQARDRARARAAAAPPIAPTGQAFAASDDAGARAALSAWLGDKATATAARLSLTPLASAFPGQVRVRLAARADEGALRRFARAIEAPALLQIGRWTVAASGDGNVTLSAEVAANWRKDAPSLPALPPGPAETGRALFASAATRDAAPISGDMPELVGIAGRIPDDAVAMLRLADGTTRALLRGATADGWRITAIAADRVTLVRDGRVHVAVLPPTSR